jgi:hypothetical protein
VERERVRTGDGANKQIHPSLYRRGVSQVGDVAGRVAYGISGFLTGSVIGFDWIKLLSCSQYRMSGSQWTPRWRRESAANSSLEAKFPVSRENTGNFLDSGLGSALTGAKKVINSVLYGPIPYASRTGNFLRPCRELNRANREILARIRESRARPRFGDSPVVTTPIVSDRSRTLPRKRTRTPPDLRSRRRRSRSSRPALSI